MAKTNNQSVNKKPVKTYQAGKIKAAIWESKDEEGRLHYSVTFTKSYKQDGQWKESNSFFPDELPRLVLVSNQAFQFIVLKESE